MIGTNESPRERLAERSGRRSANISARCRGRGGSFVPNPNERIKEK